MKGRDLQHEIIERAKALGWLVAHTPPIRTERGWRTAVAADGKGFPDLLLLRERIIVAEVKGDADRLRPEQAKWLSAFRMAGVAAFVWTPKEWAVGEVDRVLRSRAQEAYPVHPMRTLAERLAGPQEAVQRDGECPTPDDCSCVRKFGYRACDNEALEDAMQEAYDEATGADE